MDIELYGVVTLADGMTLEQFNDMFVDWIENNGMTCIATIKPNE